MKIGILGCGGIFETFINGVNAVPEASCVAVASRDLSRAQEFAKRFQIDTAYGSYLDLMKDEQVEAVYIASPHSHHYEHMQLCIEHGKHILCEKAFTVNATQAKSVLSMAKQQNLLVLEGMWTRFLPMAKTLKEVIDSNMVGEAKSMQLSICHNNIHNERVYSPALAGGTLLNLSVYALNFVSMFFGDVGAHIDGQALMTNTGVDAHNSITILYDTGRMATIHASSLSLSPGEAVIYCENGYISIPRGEKIQEIFVYDTKHQLVAEYKSQPLITGFEFQLRAMAKALAEGKLECAEMPHETTIHMMEQMDQLRKKWGLTYPCE